MADKDFLLRVMTYNLHHCEGVDGVYDVGRIADFMRRQRADIILCQEVDCRYSERSNNERQEQMLTGALGFNSFYGPNIGEKYGNLLLSRFPIERAENVALPKPKDEEPRGIIVSTISIKGRPFTVMNTHLSIYEAEHRDTQIGYIRDMVREMKAPMILSADFNTKPSEQLMALLNDGILVSTRQMLNLTEGVDDILVTQDLKGKVVYSEVIENKFSDHPAYWIDLDAN